MAEGLVRAMTAGELAVVTIISLSCCKMMFRSSFHRIGGARIEDHQDVEKLSQNSTRCAEESEKYFLVRVACMVGTVTQLAHMKFP